MHAVSLGTEAHGADVCQQVVEMHRRLQGFIRITFVYPLCGLIVSNLCSFGCTDLQIMSITRVYSINPFKAYIMLYIFG